MLDHDFSNQHFSNQHFPIFFENFEPKFFRIFSTFSVNVGPFHRGCQHLFGENVGFNFFRGSTNVFLELLVNIFLKYFNIFSGGQRQRWKTD
jgi:hypothetical protein